MIAATDTLIGTVVDGRFEIRDKLGQGGMGAVYRAWQKSTEREIAVKLIAKHQLSEPMAIERFLREARLASQLSHPNTISVYDFGKLADGRLFIAMELVRGKSLGTILKTEGALAFPRIVRIAIQICDALAAAHALKIVHRDLKHDNVMLIDGTADLTKVLDFGLAKRTDDRSLKSTAAGIVVGTPRYIAPEAMMTGASYPEGDLYALGVMIGEMALGRPLWKGDTLAELCKIQMKPLEHIQEIPEPLHGIVASLLDPTPAMRPSAVQLRERLVAMQSGAMPRYRPSQPPPVAHETAPPTVPATPAAIPDTLRDGVPKIPETPLGRTTVHQRPKPPTANPSASPWARPAPDAGATVAARARTPSANVMPVAPPTPAPAVLDKPSSRRWLPYAAAGAALFVAAMVVAMLATGSKSQPPEAKQPETKKPVTHPTQGSAADPWTGTGTETKRETDTPQIDAGSAAAAETSTSPSPGGFIGTASKTVGRADDPAKPTPAPAKTTTPTNTTTPAPVKASSKKPTECMALHNEHEQWLCLRTYCAEDPTDPLCDMEMVDGPVRPPEAKGPAKTTPAKTTPAKKTPPAKKPTTCDTCLTRPD